MYTSRKLSGIGCLILGIAAVNATAAVKIQQDGPGRASKDTGDNVIQVDLNSSASGKSWLYYNGGDLSGDWWKPRWDIGSGQTWIKVGKHFQAGSVGYPKKASNVGINKRAKYNCVITPNTTMSGKWQTGCYVWLDDDNSGLGTHELNIWNRSFSQTRSYTYHGTLKNANGYYRIYSFNNSGYKSWVIVRKQNQLNFELEVRHVLDKIQEKGMPDHNVINILAAAEGHDSAYGRINCSNYAFPNL